MIGRTRQDNGRVVRRLLSSAAAMALALAAVSPGHAQTPVSGRPVPELGDIDTIVVDYMNDNGIEAAVLGIQRNGDIVYLKGFGLLEPNAVPMPENALVRLASVTKVVTASATRDLAAASAALAMTDNAFERGQTGGGVLSVSPFGGKGDARLDDITVEQLLRHRSGWDRDADGIDDLTYKECEIADDYGVSSPPGRTRTMDWILGEPLQFDPGSQYAYSNIGYLAAGMIVEQVSGQPLLTYVRSNILTQNMWVPWHEIRLGATRRSNNLIREPWYRTSSTDWDVFDDCNSVVNRAYGGWHHQARVGQGGMISTAATMLKLADTYHVRAGGLIGTRRSDTDISQNRLHGGSLPGTNTSLYQRTDGINMFVFINNRDGSASAESLRVLVRDWINQGINDGTITWPTTTSDGFWVEPCSSDCYSGYDQGGYHAPIRSMDNADAFLYDGSKVRLTPGTYTLSDGRLDTKMRIDAPLGTAVITAP